MGISQIHTNGCRHQTWNKKLSRYWPLARCDQCFVQEDLGPNKHAQEIVLQGMLTMQIGHVAIIVWSTFPGSTAGLLVGLCFGFSSFNQYPGATKICTTDRVLPRDQAPRRARRAKPARWTSLPAYLVFSSIRSGPGCGGTFLAPETFCAVLHDLQLRFLRPRRFFFLFSFSRSCHGP